MKDYKWRLSMQDGAQSETGTVRANSLEEATDLALVDAFGSLEHVELPDEREPGRVYWGQLEGTQIELLGLLVPHREYVSIPSRLHGAARGLWGHQSGHMLSLIYDGDDLRVRLTGRGRDLAAQLESLSDQAAGPEPRLSKKEAAELERSLGLGHKRKAE
jgi:hypothetical protein